MVTMRGHVGLFIVALEVGLGLVAARAQAVCTTATIETVMLPAPDGTLLATDIWKKDNTPRPVRVWRGGAARDAARTLGASVKASGEYDLVAQDTRGTGCSAGTEFIFDHDRSDGQALINYIKIQPWTNGHVEMDGFSNGAITDYVAAPGADATLKGIATNYATGDILHYGLFNGGVLHRETADVISYTANEPWEVYSGKPMWANYLITDAQATTVNAVGIHRGGWFDVFGQGTLDSFSRMQSAGGFGARTHQKVVIGPWIHGGGPSNTVGQLTFPASTISDSPHPAWMAAWQTGVFTGDFTAYNAFPAVSVYVMGPTDAPTTPGTGWQTYTTWPPPGVELPLYFETDRSLGVLSATGSQLSFTSDPTKPVPTIGGTNNLLTCISGLCGPYDQRSIESRADVLVFTSAILAAPGKTIGRIHADLWIKTDLPDVDLFVRMTDVYPDGRSMLMAQGIQRARYRSGTCPQLLSPGVPALVRVDLSSTALVLGTGHALRVIVSASADPLYSVNPQNGDNYLGGKPAKTGVINVLLGGSTASSIVVPVTGGTASLPDERPVTSVCTADLSLFGQTDGSVADSDGAVVDGDGGLLDSDGGVVATNADGGVPGQNGASGDDSQGLGDGAAGCACRMGAAGLTSGTWCLLFIAIACLSRSRRSRFR